MKKILCVMLAIALLVPNLASFARVEGDMGEWRKNFLDQFESDPALMEYVKDGKIAKFKSDNLKTSVSLIEEKTSNEEEKKEITPFFTSVEDNNTNDFYVKNEVLVKFHKDAIALDTEKGKQQVIAFIEEQSPIFALIAFEEYKKTNYIPQETEKTFLRHFRVIFYNLKILTLLLMSFQ